MRVSPRVAVWVGFAPVASSFPLPSEVLLASPPISDELHLVSVHALQENEAHFVMKKVLLLVSAKSSVCNPKEVNGMQRHMRYLG